MRLNGWQRIGIVASVIWAVGAPIYFDNIAGDRAYKAFNQSYDRCRDVPGNDPEECRELASKHFDSVLRYRFIEDPLAVVSLIPIVFGWLLVYALVYLVRWIRAGFKS